MDCCDGDRGPTPFDVHQARRDRARYHAHGPDRTTQKLLEMIGSAVTDGATVLDIGGGIGVIDLELLRRGARRAVLVDASPAYLEAARDEAARAGVRDRMAIVAGDFVPRAGGIGAADIVTLDRVVCCYGAVDELISASADRARKLYGLVLPRDRWFVSLLVRLDNIRWRLKRSTYRAYAHANARIDGRLRAAGLRVRDEAFTSFWRVVLYERVGPVPTRPGDEAGVPLTQAKRPEVSASSE